MGNHHADRDQLNKILTDYQNTLNEWNDRTYEAFMATKSALGEEEYLITPTEVRGDIRAIQTFWDGMVAADKEAANNFKQGTAGLMAISKTIASFMNDFGNGGANMWRLNMNKLQNIMFQDEILMGTIHAKLLSGEVLSYAEREMLYFYLQNVFLGTDKRKEIESIVEMISEERIEDLMYRLNYQVLASEESLVEEMALIQAYLFRGNFRLDKHAGSKEEVKAQRKLRAYLTLLSNYKLAMAELAKESNGELPFLAKVDHLFYQDIEKPKAYIFESELLMNISRNMKDFPREEFIEIENYLNVSISKINVTYYHGSNAHSQLKEEGSRELKVASDNYTAEFIGAELMDLLDSKISKGIFGTVSDYKAGKEELQRDISMSVAESAASNLKMEMIVTENAYFFINSLEVQLVPSNATYDMLDRWETVNKINPEISYPKQQILSQDWVEVTSFFNDKESSMDKINPDLSEYIKDGSLSEGETVEVIAGRVK
ncbi:hypothetical protein SAMN05421736_1384 [Evansella caseinilytica]|uniref:Uncharacterized protein n=1 Tax=Evansella caseinilytica TaxID=1503961 RepID=A0A1H3V1V9_9BACI|nr:hypothetical protein [Evansella caseinilytica]SDZ68703.1 hypothetical protein SAMN05421736_1384 [Evansella caseinilytica]